MRRSESAPGPNSVVIVQSVLLGGSRALHGMERRSKTRRIPDSRLGAHLVDWT